MSNKTGMIVDFTPNDSVLAEARQVFQHYREKLQDAGYRKEAYPDRDNPDRSTFAASYNIYDKCSRELLNISFFMKFELMMLEMEKQAEDAPVRGSAEVITFPGMPDAPPPSVQKHDSKWWRFWE